MEGSFLFFPTSETLQYCFMTSDNRVLISLSKLELQPEPSGGVFC